MMYFIVVFFRCGCNVGDGGVWNFTKNKKTKTFVYVYYYNYELIKLS